MLTYHCGSCDMTIKGMACGKCGMPLKHATIKNSEGRDVHVSECPKKCGKIKSPTCCGHDMKPEVK